MHGKTRHTQLTHTYTHTNIHTHLAHTHTHTHTPHIYTHTLHTTRTHSHTHTHTYAHCPHRVSRTGWSVVVTPGATPCRTTRWLCGTGAGATRWLRGTRRPPQRLQRPPPSLPVSCLRSSRQLTRCSSTSEEAAVLEVGGRHGMSRERRGLCLRRLRCWGFGFVQAPIFNRLGVSSLLGDWIFR